MTMSMICRSRRPSSERALAMTFEFPRIGLPSADALAQCWYTSTKSNPASRARGDDGTSPEPAPALLDAQAPAAKRETEQGLHRACALDHLVQLEDLPAREPAQAFRVRFPAE